MLEHLPDLIWLLDWGALIYFVGLNSGYATLLIISILELYKRYTEVIGEDFDAVLRSEHAPPISILAPAFNESASIVSSTRSMLRLSYPKVEVIIINDGSTDDTLKKLIDSFHLKKVAPALPQQLKTAPLKGVYRSPVEPNLTVIDKENGGKADSLNAGINASQSPFFLAVDADSVIERDALKRMIRPVLSDSDVVAASGTIRVANGCRTKKGVLEKVEYPRRFLPSIQVVEYLRAFLFGRLGWNRLGGNLVISGAFGLFNRQVVLKCGGYRRDTVGEDMELTVRIHRLHKKNERPYKVAFIPDPVVWTEAPENWRTLARQRERWHRGLLDTVWRHKTMLFNPRYGKIGFLSFPFFIFGEALSPLIEVAGYIGLIVGLSIGAVDLSFAFLFFAVAWAFTSILTVFAILMEEATFNRYKNGKDILRMLCFAALENLGYRQFTVLARLKGFWMYFKGSKSWGRMQRVGME